MKILSDCIPCFVRQTLDATRKLGLDEQTSQDLLRRSLGLLQELDWELPPPIVGRDIHRLIRETTGDADPFLPDKIRDTEIALGLLPEVEAIVAGAEDPFLEAVKFSIAGNAIDLGVGGKSSADVSVKRTFQNALDNSLEKGAVARFKEAIDKAETILFLADNAGEIVFDRPLLERIGVDKLTVAVRGAPTINDAVLDDAKRSGITERYRVISNGSDTPGTWLSDCSSEFVGLYESADLVIAKGQGNFETLSDQARPIFFLFMAKCPPVAEELKIPILTNVIREAKNREVVFGSDLIAILEGLNQWFDDYTALFLNGDQAFCHNIQIKIGHTKRVCKEIAGLATSLGLGPNETAFAGILALLHDVGRFEQYERYHTYSDAKSENHAQLGIRVLEKNGVFERFEPATGELLRRCLGNHNLLHVPDSESEQCSFYSRLLRDADKLDIWRVLINNYEKPKNETNATLVLDMPDSDVIEEKVAKAVLSGLLASSDDLKTSADYKVLQMNWIYDVNFPLTFRLVDERKYLERLSDTLPPNDMATRIYSTVRGYLDNKLCNE